MEGRTEVRTRIPAEELAERRERLLEHVGRNRLSGHVLFDADYIQYFTGFRFLSNERPVIYAESVDGESAGSSRIRSTRDASSRVPRGRPPRLG